MDSYYTEKIAMMKKIIFFFLMSTFFLVTAQEVITIGEQKITSLSADRFIGVNLFDELFYISDNTLYKKTATNLFSYKNILLGNIDEVGVLNSFTSTLFYKDFNTFVQLDRRLGETNQLDFNNKTSFNSLSYAAITSNKRMWIFSTDTQQVQVYNPQQDIIEANTPIITEEVIQLFSNYNFCWVLTSTKLLQYNVYGNLLNSYELSGFEDFVNYKNQLFLKKENQLYLLSVEETEPEKITLPEIPIKDFSVTNETLYIYTGKELYSFTLNFNKE